MLKLKTIWDRFANRFSEGWSRVPGRHYIEGGALVLPALLIASLTHTISQSAPLAINSDRWDDPLKAIAVITHEQREIRLAREKRRAEIAALEADIAQRKQQLFPEPVAEPVQTEFDRARAALKELVYTFETGHKDVTVNGKVWVAVQEAHNILSDHGIQASPEEIFILCARESDCRTAAQNSHTQASGLFQFLEDTWLEQVRLHAKSFGFEDLYALYESNNREAVLEARFDPVINATLGYNYNAGNYKVFDNYQSGLITALGLSRDQALPRVTAMLGINNFGLRGFSDFIEVHLKTIKNGEVRYTKDLFSRNKVKRNPSFFKNPDGSWRTTSQSIAYLKSHSEMTVVFENRDVQETLYDQRYVLLASRGDTAANDTYSPKSAL